MEPTVCLTRLFLLLFMAGSSAFAAGYQMLSKVLHRKAVKAGLLLPGFPLVLFLREASLGA